MAAVAERAGVSRRAVYLHFASRTELLTELFGYVSEQEGLTASLQPVWQAPDAAAALEEWASHLARFHPRVLSVARAIQRVPASTPERTGSWSWPTSRPAASGWPPGWPGEQRLAPPWTVRTAADMLWALMSYELLEELLVDRGWSPRRYRTYLAALFESTFLCDPG